MKILIKRSEIDNLKSSELSNRFNLSDLINLSNMDKIKEIDEYFPLKNYIELKREFIDKSSMNIIVNIRDINLFERTLKIKGADLGILFITSKFDMEKLKLDLDKNLDNILVELMLRKHEENIFFVENIKPLKNLKEKNYQELLEVRKKLSTDEWKNLLLNSLNYNLSESEGILKDLMLVRLLPYLEKNYSYIELGPYSTGKTALGDLFSSSVKISPNISISELEYNLKEKREGLMYSKDVLYLDESNFADLKKETAIMLLQILSENQHNTRGNLLDKKIDISVINQGNVENGIKKYKDKTIFDNFNRSFNKGAFLDRANFFIAGWLIPSYSKIKETGDKEIIPLNIFEDFLKIQREKTSYFNYLEDIEIKLISDQSEGRFISAIEKTVSAFLKLLYPDGTIDFETDKDELEKIIVLSILGKYAIHYLTTLGIVNNKVEVFYKGKNIITIDMNILFRDYIESREDRYFQSDLPKTNELSFSEFKAKWKNDNNQNLNERELKRIYKRDQINRIPQGYEKILDRLQDDIIKEKYIELLKIVVTYKIEDYIGQPFSEEFDKEQEEFFYALFSIVVLFDRFSKYDLDTDEKNFLLKFVNMMINNERKELYQWNKQGEVLRFNSSIVFELSLKNSSDIPFAGPRGKRLNELKRNIMTNLEIKNKNYPNIREIKSFLKEYKVLDSDTVNIKENFTSRKIELWFSNKEKINKKESIYDLLIE